MRHHCLIPRPAGATSKNTNFIYFPSITDVLNQTFLVNEPCNSDVCSLLPDGLQDYRMYETTIVVL
jgi:hypothetical protein